MKMINGRRDALSQQLGAILLVMFPLVTASPVLAEDDLARDSAHLRELLREVHAILPPGWRAEITPDVPTDIQQWRRNEVPCLAIWRVEKTLGERIYPGMPPRSAGEDPPYESIQLELQFTLTQFLALDEHRRVAYDNAAGQAQREQFFRSMSVDSMRVAYKGNFPPSPRSVQAETAEQKEVIRQYAFLWSRTEPVELPTHYYHTLSFSIDHPPIRLKDQFVAAEYEGLQQGLLKIVTPYPKVATQ